ncbi:MAG TPA: 1,4-alpha-glucan branching protein GlgB [Polyangiaceae bacterium]|nr:1,4-alpha-glucan branching protein GlgB [Polyangiaceae bacterium]
MENRRLEQLAALYGVEPSYYDVKGRLQVASREALIAMLACLGCDVTHDSAIPDLVRARQAALAGRLVPRIGVRWGTAANSIALRLRQREASTRAEIHVALEDGTNTSFAVGLDDARLVRRIDAGSEEYVDLDVALPKPLPVGYHVIEAHVSGRGGSGNLWVAPERAYGDDGKPGFGLFTPTYSLRSARNEGVGDFADLETLSRFIGEKGGSTLATLPLLPTFLDGPHDPSPYSPVSRLFWNEIYIALDRIANVAKVPRAAELWANPKYRATAEELRNTRTVDYLGVLTHKRRLLMELSEAAFADAAERKHIDDAVAARPLLADYARFRALMERQRRPFRQWPARVRDRIESADIDASSYRYHLYCQVLAAEQLATLAADTRARGVGLYMDLPLGAHSDGYDAFRYADELLPDCSTGAPPDALFEGGQNWGFSPPNPENGRLPSHGYFIACLRHQMRHASILRIDHVMGLHRLFCIPKSVGAADGVYVRQHAEELYAAVCIESHRSKTVVVGEDLGTVPDEVRESMARHGVGRLFVLQYEDVPSSSRSYSIPDGSVASLNTHDMPTFTGFLRGRDIETRRELGLIQESELTREKKERAAFRDKLEQSLELAGLLERPSTDETLLEAGLVTLGRSRARVALSSVDDMLLEPEPQNVPGTSVERPNWRRKHRKTLEEIVASEDIELLLHALHRTGSPEKAHGIRSKPSTFLSDMDLHLFNEGTHQEIQDKLGAHPGVVDGVSGTFFSTWAPNAASVHLVGDFNGWTSLDAPLFPRGGSGVWECFVPGLGNGDLYKLRIQPRSGYAFEKADPFALRAETPPRTASVVWTPTHEWQDSEWMKERWTHNALDSACSIYEVHLGSFRRAPDGSLLNYRDIAGYLVEHVKRLGFTHVELMPVMEHPFYGSWGYQTTGYFAATSRYGSPDDLMTLVDTLHRAGIGVIFDWVPGHFPTDGHGLGMFDGTHLYEHADPRRGFHPDWKSHIFNYGRHEVRSFLTSSALHWFDRFHGDGIRVDGVASMLYLDYSRQDGQWIPNQYGGRENLEAIAFLRWLNESIYGRFSDVQTTAEESTSWPMVSRPTYLGGLGFGTKWDMGWMHDTLDYFSKDPIYRKFHHNRLTFRGMYAWHENFVLPLSHDEVVHGKGSLFGKMPGDDWQRFANLRLLFSYQWACPGHKLLFMGSELAMREEWNHDSSLNFGLLDSPPHAGVARLVGELNRIYRSERALFELDQRPEGFAWVDVENADDSVLAFERRSRSGERILAVFNFTPVVRRNYRVGVSSDGYWREILNSNGADFGGTGEGNFGGVHSQPVVAQGRQHSLSLTLPPLAALYFRSP